MLKLPWLVLLTLLAACTSVSAPTPPTPPLPPLVCNAALWEHTYSKDRFTITSLCAHEVVTVTFSGFSEDGDFDMDALDADGRFLELEVPCARQPNVTTNPGREASEQHVCGSIIPDVPPALVAPGSVLEVAGPNVVDLRHGWREIHGVVYRLKP